MCGGVDTQFKPYQIRSGETIAKQGDKGDQRLFLVAEGSVRKEITTRGSDGGTFVTEKNFLMYGEGGFLFNKPRTGDVITNQDTLVYAVSSDDVANIFGNDAWSLYSLIATQLAHKQTAKSNNKNIKDQQDALLENAIPKKLSQAHALPQSEIILSSGKCQATSRSLAKGHGTLFIMRRYVLFHASSWKGGSSSVIYSRDILRVEGPSVVVGKGGIIGLIVRVVKSDGRVQAQEVQLSFALIHVASDIAEYLRTVTRRQHDFRMTSTNKIT
jgi:CRP-like cAMP-binding protein